MRKHAMIAAHCFRQAEFREQLTEVIIQLLAHLPEAQRNIFIWNRYRGYPLERIADMLGRDLSEVETIVTRINSILYQRAGALLDRDLRFDSDDNPSGAAPQENEYSSYLDPTRNERWLGTAQP
jgi:sigma-70-like protein